MNAEDRHFEIARSLFREANDAFFLFKPGSQIVLDLNPAALRMTGMEKRVACTLSLSDLFSSNGPEDLQPLAKALNRTGFFHSREGYFLRRATGRPLPVNVSVSLIHTEPEPIGLVVRATSATPGVPRKRSGKRRLATTASSSRLASSCGSLTVRV